MINKTCTFKISFLTLVYQTNNLTVDFWSEYQKIMIMQNFLNVRRKTVITKRKKVRENSDNIFVSKDINKSTIKVSWGRAIKINKVELYTIAGVNISSCNIGINQDSVVFNIPNSLQTSYVVKSYSNSSFDIKTV
jgi:hypothetical protein